MTTTMGFDSKGNVRRSPWRLNTLVCCMALAGYAQAAPHEVNGQAGDPASWRSAEFNANWGWGDPRR